MKQDSFINYPNSDLLMQNMNDDNGEGGDVNVWKDASSADSRNTSIFPNALLMVYTDTMATMPTIANLPSYATYFKFQPNHK